MTVFLLAMAALVVIILLTRLSPPARWVERRSVTRYERSVDVLRSLSNHRFAEHPVDHAAPTPPGLQTPPPEQTAVAEAGAEAGFNASSPATAGDTPTKPAFVFVADDAGESLVRVGEGPVTAGESPVTAGDTAKPAFVFPADDAGADPLKLNLSPGPTSAEDSTPSLRERLGAFVAALSSAMGQPRVRIAGGLATIVVAATVVGTLLSLTSSSPNRTQRVRQVSAPPPAEVPAPPSTIQTPTSTIEEGPATTSVAAQPAAQAVEPTRSTSTPTPWVVVTPPSPAVPVEPSSPPGMFVSPSSPSNGPTTQPPDPTPPRAPTAPTPPEGSGAMVPQSGVG